MDFRAWFCDAHLPTQNHYPGTCFVCNALAKGKVCFTCEGEQGLPATRTVRICEQCFGEDEAALATPSPQHPFEVRISIGGDDWEYVRRAVRDLLEHVESREPNEVGCSSGGGGGCHSIDLQRRDVSAEQFREELQAWHQRVRIAKEPAPAATQEPPVGEQK